MVGERIITNTPSDEIIGKLLAQAENWRLQQERSDRLMERFGDTLERLSTTVTRLDENVGHLSRAIETYSSHGPRLSDCETDLEVMKRPIARWELFESRIFYYALGICLLAMGGGFAAFRLTEAHL